MKRKNGRNAEGMGGMFEMSGIWSVKGGQFDASNERKLWKKWMHEGCVTIQKLGNQEYTEDN